MTLKQEIYERIDQMTEDKLRILIDKMKIISVTGFKQTADFSKTAKKERFLKSAGKIKINEQTINALSEK